MLPLDAVVVSYWVKVQGDQDNRGRVKIVLQTASGRDFGNEAPDYEVDLSNSSKLRMYGKIGGIPVSGLGAYRLSVRLQRDGQGDWVEVGHYSFLVSAQTA
jgi:hypothetical protein